MHLIDVIVAHGENIVVDAIALLVIVTVKREHRFQRIGRRDRRCRCTR